MIKKIIEDLDAIDKRDVMLESINDKLTKSLMLYLDTLEKSCSDILDSDCLKVVNKLVGKYSKKVEVND